MSIQLAEFIEHYRPLLEETLLHHLPISRKPGTEILNQAIYYAIFPGGKRIRPLFTLLATYTIGGDPKQAITVACAVEYLHTCSIILDDLPAMDDSVERRGRKPTHRVFGEDVSILAALAFFNQGYVLIGLNTVKDDNIKFQSLIKEMTNCIGPNGMIGGQMVDLRLRANDKGWLRTVSYLKTTSLMRLMLTAGAIVAGAKDFQIHIMATFGENLGKVYQMLDDIVDGNEDSSADILSGQYVDALTLWQKAEKQLEESRTRLIKSLAFQNPALLLAFVDDIFGRLKKQAASCLAIQKRDLDTFAQNFPFRQFE
ncbi:MAG: polyprenyl synthetase family protein [Thermodesulfobacteriota bacterium]|nr:polyprenyl synthetase family protein [Thermodesulfobacteriota bacterium]